MAKDKKEEIEKAVEAETPKKESTPTPTPVAVEKKAWSPNIKLNPKHDSETKIVRVSRVMRSIRQGEIVIDSSFKAPPRTTLDRYALTAYPATNCRKYNLWHLYTISPSDKARLLEMTIAEIASKERSGNW